MDPLTQGALGAAAAVAGAPRGRMERAGTLAVLGAIAGMAPDLDVLIRSDSDPLLFLEYHRQFTHALVFIPVGALLCALVCWPAVRRRLSFRASWLACTLGYGTHGLLDACTSYGTQLLWPFSNVRIAWNNIAVIDPLVTLPLLTLLAVGVRQGRRRWAVVGLAWTLTYLGAGLIQHERAIAGARELAAQRAHRPEQITAKPSFANILIWKTVYLADGTFHIDAVRTGRELRWLEGGRVPRLDPARDLGWLDPSGQQRRDVDRFSWFSNGYVALDPRAPDRVMDIRYSLLPQEIAPLWGIQLRRDAGSGEHVEFVTERSDAAAKGRTLWQMLRDPTVGSALPTSGRD